MPKFCIDSPHDSSGFIMIWINSTHDSNGSKSGNDSNQIMSQVINILFWIHTWSPHWLKRLTEFWLDFRPLHSDDGLLWSKSIWHHRMKRIRPIFQRNRDLCSLTCCHWLDWRHRAWLIVRRGPHLIVLASYLDISKVIRGHWPQMTLSLP